MEEREKLQKKLDLELEEKEKLQKRFELELHEKEKQHKQMLSALEDERTVHKKDMESLISNINGGSPNKAGDNNDITAVRKHYFLYYSLKC